MEQRSPVTVEVYNTVAEIELRRGGSSGGWLQLDKDGRELHYGAIKACYGRAVVYSEREQKKAMRRFVFTRRALRKLYWQSKLYEGKNELGITMNLKPVFK